MNLKDRLFHFDPAKSTYQLPIVVATFFIGVAITIAATVTIVITDTWDLPFCWTGKCYAYAFTLFAVPIKVTVATVALITLWALFHRSEQTRTQINLITEQNVFTNHYKHLEDFERLIDNNLEKFKVLSHIRTRELHRYLFPNTLQKVLNDPSDRYRISQEVITKTVDLCEKILVVQDYLYVGTKAPREILITTGDEMGEYCNLFYRLIHEVFFISIADDTFSAIRIDAKRPGWEPQPRTQMALYMIRDMISADRQQDTPSALQGVISATGPRFSFPGHDEQHLKKP